MKSNFSILLLFLPVVIISESVSAQYQQSQVDSIKALISTQPEDSSKARNFSLLSWHYASTRTETKLARLYADSSMMLSQKIGDENRIAIAHYYYGLIDRYEGNYEEALDHLNRHIQHFTQQGDSSLVADGLYHNAVIYRQLGDYEQSLATYYRILKISESDENKFAVASVNHSIGLIHRQLSNYDKALESYQKALNIFEALDNSKNIATVLNSLGSLHGEKEEYETAAGYYERAIKLNSEMGNSRAMAFQIANLGHIASQLNDHEKSLAYHIEALNIRENLPQKIETLSSLRNVGQSYKSLGNYSQSRRYLEQALILAKDLQAKPHIRDLYQMLSELNELENNPSEALDFHKLYVATKDSILNEESASQINELQAKYETAVKNEEIAILTRNNELGEIEVERRASLNRALAGGLFLITISSGLVIILLRQRFKNQQLVTAKNEEIKTTRFKQQLGELEMKALRAQMNPHFMFNCMNSINRMILSEENENASRYLTKFSKLIRLMLQNSGQPNVSLEDELAMLETYIQLESLRFKDKINYSISVDTAVNKENIFLPSMVLQPFIENAIWHGLMHKDGKGLIRIEINENGDLLHCVIEDNGVGRKKALELQENSILEHKSMGLQITEDRLKLLSKSEMQKLIHITDLKDSVNHATGTRVDINIPIASLL
jgi:tetratricopeptide (TPR) repeat protein